MRELNSVNKTFWANNVGNVRNRCSGGGTEIENLRFFDDCKTEGLYLFARAHVNVVDTTKDGGSQLGTEGIPRSVLDFLDWVCASLWCWDFNLYRL